jgi:pimeloyl-ACP methyl ester carboxylesterase
MKLTVRSGAAELCVEDSGTPVPALVCLHAGVCDRRMWMAQIDALRARHRVVAYDRRGFGETRYAPAPHAQVDDLLAVLDALRIERAVLMGCSQGGRIAIDTALAHPARVRALVLVACAVSGAPEEDSERSPRVRARIEAYEAAERRGDHTALNELEAQFWLDGPEQAAGRVGGAPRSLFLAMNGIALAAPSPGEERIPPSAWDRLAALCLPGQIVWGTLDFADLDTRMRELARRIAGAQTFLIDGTAHLPGLERPALFNAAVAGFLDRL